MKKKFVSVLIALSMIVPSSAIWADENNEATSANESVVIQESTTQDDTEPTSDEKNVDIKESTEEESDVDSSKYETVVMKGDEFVLTVGSKTYKKNNSAYKLTAAPITVEGRTYIPLRFAAEQIIEGTLEFNQGTNVANIIKDDLTLKMTVGNKVAYLNGSAITLDNKPLINNGTAYIPLSVIKNYFGLSVDYNGAAKKITIVGKSKGTNIKPIASFTFDRESFSQGQTISITETSYDPDSESLTDKRWCVVDSSNNMKTGEALGSVFKSPQPGDYKVGLKVKDQNGLWSEWHYQDITILPNKPPVITKLVTDKESYAQGEKITYKYEYENEAWENITNEKWTYRREGEATSKALLGSPSRLFMEGDYIVTLQIDDTFGNRSDVYEAKIHISDEVLSSELNFRFTYGSIGDIIDNYQEFNYRDYDDAEITSTSMVPGTMIMSDSPEEVSQVGILYEDIINGDGRILIHHINRFNESSTASGAKRLIVVAENKGSQPTTITLKNKNIKGPVNDILFLGQKLLFDYLVGSGPEVITLQPGEKTYIYDSSTKWKQDMCISGLMDVNTTDDVKFTVAAVSPGSQLKHMVYLNHLTPAVHPRGTFDGIGINYELDLDASKPTKLILGNGYEEWVKGYDAITLNEAYNKGNYGISYYVTLTAKEDMGIILNPRANVYRGAIEWIGDGVYNVPASGAIFSNPAKAIVLGTIKAGETKTFEYMLPNGSSAPIVIGFIPKSQWNG